ncbi:MAG TPA: TlpA disulfide reductase family protein [Marmoricola sp.]
MRQPVRTLIVSVTCLAALVALGGCGAAGTGTKGYIDGEGVITQVSAAHRKQVGSVDGTTLDGTKVDLASYRGKVVVVNLWWSHCPPCRLEAPHLAAAARALQPKGVVFLGIDTRDGARSMGRAYQRRFDVPYPSIFDPDGETLLAFRGTLSPNAIPSTMVIDKQGRIAATVLGALGSQTTLYDLVADAGGPSVKDAA